MAKLQVPQETVERAALLVAQGKTVTEICKTLKTNRHALIRWRKHKQFQEALAQAHAVHLNGARAYAAHEAAKLVKTLVGIANSEKSRDSDRIAAIKTVFEYGRELPETTLNQQNNYYGQQHRELQTTYESLLKGEIDEQTVEAKAGNDSGD